MNIFEPQVQVSQADLEATTSKDVKIYLEALFARVSAMIPDQKLQDDLFHYEIRVIEAHDTDSENDPCELSTIAKNQGTIQAFEPKEGMKSGEDSLEHSYQQGIVAHDLDDRKLGDSQGVNYQLRIIEVHDSDSETEPQDQQMPTTDKEVSKSKIESLVQEEPETTKREGIDEYNVQIESKQESHDQVTYEINVFEVDESESQAHSEEQSVPNLPESEQKIPQKKDQVQQNIEIEQQNKDLAAEIDTKQIYQHQNEPKTQTLAYPKEHTNIVQFKRSHKAFKSQLTRRQKFNDQNSDINGNRSRNRHAIDSSRSMAIPNFKPKSGYNQLKDKTLVQYFYPKQKKIIKNQVQEQKAPSPQRQRQYQPQKIFKSCRSQKKYNFTKLFNRSCEKGYSTLQECGRKSQFTDYDLISCKSSLSHLKSYQNLFCQTVQPQHSQFDTSRFSETTVLRHRIANLQSRVYEKVPYLIKMGVNFRKLTKR